jgi:hypothetical protein
MLTRAGAGLLEKTGRGLGQGSGSPSEWAKKASSSAC